MGIDAARGAAARYLQVPVIIYDRTNTVDDSGGVESTYTRRPGTVPGWVGAPTARRAAGGMADREPSEVAGQVENTSVLVLTLPFNCVIHEGDRVKIQDLMWQVTALLTLRTQTAVDVRVLIREV